MKKGKVYFNQQENKKILIKSDNTEIKLPKNVINFDLPKNKKLDCEYSMTVDGGIEKFTIKITDKNFKPQQKENYINKSKNNQNKRSREGNQNGNFARSHAPYNFVPLNDSMISADETGTREYTGYIDLTINNITPLFSNELKGKFYRRNGNPIIPGSTMRGLFRTMSEIITFGKFVNFERRSIFYRENGRINGHLKKLGFLQYVDGKFVVWEQTGCVRPFNRSNVTNEFHFNPTIENGNLYIEIFSGSIQAGVVRNFKIEYKKNNIKYDIPEKIIQEYQDDDLRDTTKEMADLTRTALKLDNNIAVYIEGLKNPSINYFGIPVWFQLDRSNFVKSFGHCKNYRVKYNHEIGNSNNVPSYLTDEKISDFTENLFGIAENGGRLFFEDNILENAIFEENILQILSSPKPKSAQHYLEQNGAQNRTWNTANSKIRGYKMYWHRSTDASRNPYFNWRKTIFRKVELEKFLSTEEINSIKIQNTDAGNLNLQIKPWQELPNEIQAKFRAEANKESTQFKVIECLKTQQIFKNGRVRFENLTEIELGLLLFIINLPKKLAYKLGMGKSLGLGSVIIKGELHLSALKSRYNKIFNDDEFDQSEIKYFDIEKCIKKFEEYMKLKLKVNSSFWGIPRMKELENLLDSKNLDNSDNWLNETRYMEMEEFNANKWLPTPTEVIDIFKNLNK